MSIVSRTAPHVAAVHDLSGIGRCSLGVVAPVLSAMGCWCSALPTAYLSANTIFPPSGHFVFRDLTGEMEGSLDHWEELNISFDALYSGFVGSEAQIGVVADFFRRFRREGTVVLVDPVMGDWGKPYRTYTPAMCERMKELALLADVITPNLTEAALLLDEPFHPGPYTHAYIESLLRKLGALGPQKVVLPGVYVREDELGAATYDRTTDTIDYVFTQKIPGYYHGTGDVFASALLSALLNDFSLIDAAAIAVHFTTDSIRRTYKAKTDYRFGVNFEQSFPDFLKELKLV